MYDRLTNFGSDQMLYEALLSQLNCPGITDNLLTMDKVLNGKGGGGRGGDKDTIIDVKSEDTNTDDDKPVFTLDDDYVEEDDNIGALEGGGGGDDGKIIWLSIVLPAAFTFVIIYALVSIRMEKERRVQSLVRATEMTGTTNLSSFQQSNRTSTRFPIKTSDPLPEFSIDEE